MLHPDIQEALRETSPHMSTVLLAKTVICYGTRYTAGMILSYGSTCGLPDFAKIIQMAILDNCANFIVKFLAAWYEEHLSSFQLEDTGKMARLEQQKLGDVYPLAAYSVGGKCLVTLKHHISKSVNYFIMNLKPVQSSCHIYCGLYRILIIELFHEFKLWHTHYYYHAVTQM